ncbi:hypothetical protein HK102_002744 [Quaeritorhiza haematococci]|nr:hypothetical protein HK102_002744 [Quaeritorhiza haematococci]
MTSMLAKSALTTTTFDALVASSKAFRERFEFYTTDNLIEKIAGTDVEKQAAIARHAQKVRIIVHADLLPAIETFLARKRREGFTDEKSLYAKMTTEDFIRRCIEKRPLAFLNSCDTTLTRDGTFERMGRDLFRRSGSPPSDRHLPIEDYLTYEEMAFSALLGVSTPTFFINQGTRDNRGVKADAGTYEPFGIMVGLVGARFELPTEMESRFVMANGVVAEEEWRLFYSEALSNKAGLRQDKRFLKVHDRGMFDTAVYRRRMRVTIETLLFEAELRAKEFKKPAYVHVVGLGLGVWQLLSEQADLFVAEFFAAIAENPLEHVAVVDFSWFNNVASDKTQTKSIKSKNGVLVKILFTKRPHAEKLKEDLLLVTSYAWDSNSFPGNEFWLGSLTGSGDPAAACCCTIGELQNPLVNPFTSRIVTLSPNHIGDVPRSES